MTTPDVQPYITWQQVLGLLEVRNVKQIAIKNSLGVDQNMRGFHATSRHLLYLLTEQWCICELQTGRGPSIGGSRTAEKTV